MKLLADLLSRLFGVSPDPKYHCPIYRDCAHVDGPLCHVPTCPERKAAIDAAMSTQAERERHTAEVKALQAEIGRLKDRQEQSQQPSPASASDMAVYQSIADGYPKVQQPGICAACVMPEQCAVDIAERGPCLGGVQQPMPLNDSRIDSLIESAIQGHAGTRDAMRWLVRQLATKKEPMTAEQSARIAELEAEITNLHTTMMAAAVEIHAHWDAHCDSEGYGPANLMHRLERGIASQYGYDAKTLQRAESERDQLRAEVDEQARLNGMGAERELALRAEVERLHRAITEFCQSHSWAADAWKAEPSIKPLFDITRAIKAAKEAK